MTNSEKCIHLNPDAQDKKPIHVNNSQPNLNYKYLEEKHKVIWETKEHLNKEQLIHQVKTDIYKKMWIDVNLNKNNPVENFEKWIIDILIIGNYDLAIEIYNTNGKVLIDALKQLASLEWLKQIAEALGESITWLFTWNAYEKWKSFAELWLIWTWAFAGLKIAKFWAKKLKNRDVPKHNFDKLSIWDIAKLNDVDRLKVASFYLKKEFNREQKNAILKAHNVGINRELAGIHNYNFSEKWEKLKILEKAWFTKKDRKLLLEKWVCGKEYKTISEDDLPYLNYDLERKAILSNTDITIDWLNKIINDHSFYESMTFVHKEILNEKRKFEILGLYNLKNIQTAKLCKFAFENYNALTLWQKVVLKVYISQIIKNTSILIDKISFKNKNWAHFVTQANILLEWHLLNKTMNKLWLDKEVLHKLQEVRDKRLELNKKIVAYN